MLNGHFDYGNGYHGRVYLNPHQLFRHPSTIWRLAQDLLDVLPARSAREDRSRRRPGDGRRAARAHARRPARRPPRADPSAAAASRRSAAAATTTSRCARFYAREMAGKRVLLADDVRNTGKTFERCAELVEQAAARSSPRSRSATAWRRWSTLGVPNFALAEYKAPENFAAADCPMCKAGEPITSF